MNIVKIFHTADWHLGKIVQGIYMTEDQAYVLDQFVQAVKDERPDVVIIAGDLYDRAVPPTDAVELLNHIFEELVLQLKVPVLAIAGNHDSPDRIQFAVKLMRNNGLYMAGQLQCPIEPITLFDETGPVEFYLIPYADPSIVRHILNDERIHSHQEAMDAIVTQIKDRWNPDARHVLIGHAFVTPYGEQENNTSDAERPLSVGGAEYVSAQLLADFDYVALGHLHQAHHVGIPHIRYSGSPLKYSISEETHQKGYLVVELASSEVQVEKVSLDARRDMRRISGKIEDLEQHSVNEDYVYVTLTDENPVLFPMERIRAVYPNAMHVDRIASTRAQLNGENKEELTVAKKELKPVELFSAFYEEVRGEKLSASKQSQFASIYDQLMRGSERL